MIAFALEGFHVLGCTSTLRGDARVLTYDITPTDVAVRAVPPLAFAYFDPTAGTYRVARTVALPLAVSAGTLSSKAAIPRTAGVDDIYPPPALPANPGDPHALRHLTVALALAQPWLAALLVFAWQRARARARHDPLGQRARRAAAAFAAAIRAPATDPGDALAEYLAARLRCPRAAVVGPDLEARLAAAGVAAPLGVRTAELLRDLLAARYGGTATDDRDAPARLVAELEAVFTAAGGAA